MNLKHLRTYITLFRTVFRRHRGRVLILSFLGFVNGALDSAGIGMLIPLFSLTLNDPVAGTDMITRSIRTVLALLGFDLTLASLLTFAAVVFGGKAIGEFLLVYLRVRISADYAHETQSGLYVKTLHSAWPYLLTQRIGHLENILTSDVRASEQLLKHVCGFAPNAARFAAYFAVALSISTRITLISLAAGLVILAGSKPLFSRTKKLAARVVALNKIIAHRINQSVQGLKTIKSMALEEAIASRMDSVFAKHRTLRIKTSFLHQLGRAFIEPLAFVFIIALFAFSYARTDFNLARFGVVVFLIQRIFGSVKQVQQSMHTMEEAFSHTDRIEELERATEEYRERDRGRRPFGFQREIAFERVRFAYRANAPVLEDVTFRVSKNEMVGIAGPSGAGKTTIADLLLRLVEPSSGRILIDGVPVSEIALGELRSRIGYVAQDIFLENDTIEKNIRFYADDRRISGEDMLRAARLAHCFDFVTELPEGFKSVVGERGVKLSAGQRQRIVLARVLARRPEILILDEATSALDNESESMIKQAIEDLKARVTVIVIAHRLTTVMNADRLLVLDRGRIVEEGPPHSLLQDKNSYFSKTYAIA